MAVQPQTPYKEYDANGVAKSFNLEFDCENKDHLIVTIDGVEPPSETWSLDPLAKNVTFTNAPDAGKKITLKRNTPYSRNTSYQSYDNSFRPGPVNKDFDRVWLKIQELGVADWILHNRIDALKAYVDQQDSELQQNIDNLKIYVDDKDDELRAYLLAEIQKQGVALDQLDEYYNYLMQRLAQIAVDKGWDASFVVDGNTTQKEINRFVARPFESEKVYGINEYVRLANGQFVYSDVMGNTNNPNINMTGWVNPIVEASTFSNYDIAEAELTKVYLARKPITMVLRTDGTDETVKIKAYLAKAKELARPLELPPGLITFTQTLEIDFKAIIRGQGRETAILQFKNTIPNAPAILLKRGSTKSSFSDFLLRDENANMSTGIRMTDSLSETGSPCWKNAFNYIDISGFSTGLHITSANPLNGATHAHCDGNVFIGCRFGNCRISILNQNCQAVNNQFYGLVINNADSAWLNGQTITDTNFEMLRDEAGGGFNITGLDMIGRGKLYTWLYPTGGSGLFQGSASFKATDVRGELRSTHNGVIIEEGVHGNASAGMQMDISVQDARFITFGQSVDLFRFAGKLKAQFNNVSAVYGTGKLTVRLYPTSGRSANTSGALADVYLVNCGKVYYEKATTSPYGTYDISSTPSVVFDNDHTSSTNASYVIDALGFREMQSGGSIQQLGFGLNFAGGNSGRLIFNNDNTATGAASEAEVKFKLPKYARPVKAFLYKLPVRFADNVGIDVYVVKDNARWVNPASFDIATDATLVATSPITTNQAGYFEYPLVLASNIVGSAFQSGFNTWLEGRMLFKAKGGASFIGWFGIEYI